MSMQGFLGFIGLAFVLISPSAASAANPYLHYFDCKNCHFPNATMAQMSENHICLKCHSGAVATSPNDRLIAAPAYAQIDNASSGVFSTGDASASFGHNPSPVQQTSHNWSALNTQPAAGAQEPNQALYTGFYSRYGASLGKVTCSRCHNPHGEAVLDADSDNLPDNNLANPKLLVADAGNGNKPMDPEKMCRACHDVWANTNNHGWLTHPLVADYATAVAAKPGYKSAQSVQDAATEAAADGRSAINLISYQGATGIGCLSCHAVHFADSDAGTADGVGNTLNSGDGKLLRADGAGRADTSALCQTCHTYQVHGSSEQVGCLVCHSGHSYDPTLPNYFILRKTTTTTTYGTKTGLDYSSPDVLDAGQKFTFWDDQNEGTAGGYCEKCHGDTCAISAGGGGFHTVTAVCTDCHRHGGTTGTFAPGCNLCHGMPPTEDTPGVPDGLVVTPAPTNSTTAGAHTAHVTTKQYTCDSCHYSSAGRGATHNDGAPQSITIGFSLFNNAYRGGTYNGQGGVNYDSSQADTTVTNSGAKTCANVYCHGNWTGSGGANTTPTWGGSVACGDCHAATAGTLTTGSHAAHLTRLNGPDGVVGSTLDCDGCHGSGAKLGTHVGHVNGVATFADGNTLATTSACNTCHSPTGSYDGVNDATLGAKDNWRTGIYTDGNLIAGKERWCVTCHDESPANSKADGTGVSARNMVGNNSTWGFYQTGHGADISVDCVQCHSTRMPHIDHIYTPILDVMKTTQNPNNYRFYVGKGMRMPYDRSSAPESRELCISCHSETNLFKQSGLPADATSNFRSDYADGTGYQNLHFSYHREGSNCITCHDPHGTSAPRMTADDRIGRFRLTTLNAGDGKYYELSDRALWNSAANNHGGASTGSASGCGTCHGSVTLSAGASEPSMGMYQRLLVPISFLTVTDLDTDGLPDTNDNCPAVSNVDQTDTDGDGVGDACDLSPGGFDPSNRDRDYDGIGDVSDSCPDDPNNDIDGDGFCIGAGFAAPKTGGNDNCPVNANPTQADTDGDGHPDACDNCPSNANADQSDYDLDGIGDTCDAICDSFRSVWSQFLDPPTGKFWGLALDASDNVYGAGHVRVTALPGLTYVGGYSDLAIVKYDKNGNLLAKAELGSPDDGWEGFEDVAVDNATGFVYAIGYTTGSLPGYTNLGSSDVVLAKYDADLNQIWARQIATAGYDHGFALDIDASGNIYVGARISSYSTLFKYDPAGNELWNQPFGGTAGAEITSIVVDGAYVYAGGAQAGNVVVRQFNLDGTAGWSSQQGTDLKETSMSIVVTGGNVFVAGTTYGSFPGFTLEGTEDIFVLKLNQTDGTLMAATQFNAPDSQQARGIDTDSTGAELYVTGSSMSGFIAQSPGIQWDAFLLSFDTDLNVLRRRQLADASSNTNEDIAVSKLDGSIYLAGARSSGGQFTLLKEQKGCP